MKILEIRLSENLNKEFESEIEQVKNDLRKDKCGDFIKCYKKTNLSSDYLIIIENTKNTIDSKNSYLGQRLKAFLNVYGLINHTLWNEMGPKNKR